MDRETREKIANNILELMLNPTNIPVRERIYFRPGEILDNEIYERSKMDASMAYRGQRQNSDFYPVRNRTQTQREVLGMDRRTLIASLDVLSQQFAKEGPFATELRTMAYAVSQMSDEDLQVKLAEMDVEAKGKAKMVKCPQCGANVLEATGYCLACKEKIEDMGKGKGKGKGKSKAKGKKKADDEQWSQELDNAVMASIVSDVTGTEWRAPEASEGQTEMVEATEEKEAARKTINVDITKLNRLMEVMEKAGMVEEGVTAEAVIEAVLAMLTDDRALMQRAVKWISQQKKKADDEGEKEAQEQPSTEVDEVEVVEEEAPAKKKEDKEAGKIKGPGNPDGTGPASETGECPMKKEDKSADETESSEVNTDVLEASEEEGANTENIEGIEFNANGNIDPVEMSDEEAARLGSIFNFDPEMTPEEKDKFDQLLGK